MAGAVALFAVPLVIWLRYAAGQIVLAAALVLSAPVTLINPDRIYSFLIKPPLVALWLSQLIVFAVYPGSPGTSRTAGCPPGR
jgi:hypothetical protein